MTAPDEDALRPEDAIRVRRALGLIKPTQARRDECHEAVEIALINLDYTISQQRSAEHSRTKAGKKATEQLVAALRRLDFVLKNRDLDLYTRLYFANTHSAEWQKWLEYHKAKTPSGKLTRMVAETKRHAVREAHALMQEYGATGAAKDTKKGSDFCRLAALIFGRPATDLRNQCKAFCRKKPASK
jgi:hypothetical protein